MTRFLTGSALTAAALLLSFGSIAYAFNPAAGDLAKSNANDVRVLQYNIHDNLVTVPAITNAELKRVFQAINPDIVALEEMDQSVTAAQLKATLESYFPGSTWTVNRGVSDGFDRNALATRHTLTQTITDTIPASEVRGVTAGLVTTASSGSIYTMAVHFKCCTDSVSTHQRRQKATDGIINWMRDARTPGGNINLPANTPMLVVGDFNVGQNDNDDLPPYHASRTILDGDIFDQAIYGADSPPDWDGTSNMEGVPYDHTNGDPHTWASDASAPASRFDRFVYTDSVLHVSQRFVLNTKTMAAGALTAAGLQANDTFNGSDHLPCVVDFAVGAETGTEGPLLINEFSADDAGTDDRSFLEIINTGTREVILEAPFSYRLTRTDTVVPIAPPATENEATSPFNLRGVIPPGGLFVLYNAAGNSSGVASTITSLLPSIQRQTSGSFSLFNAPGPNGIALVKNQKNSDGVSVYTNVDSYLYSNVTNATHYFRTNTADSSLITFDAINSAGALTSDTQSFSRDVGDTVANSFAGWTNPDDMTPGAQNHTAAGPSLTPSPSPSPTASATPSLTETPSLTASPTASPTASLTASPTASPTASLTASPTLSPTVSPTASPTASLSPTQSATPSQSQTLTASLTASPTPTASPVPTANAQSGFRLY